MVVTFVTSDLSQFGYNELTEAIALLNLYKDNTSMLGDGLTININRHSGCVYLSDNDLQVVVRNGDKLEYWLYCGNCGHEGLKSDLINEAKEAKPDHDWVNESYCVNCEQYGTMW